MKIEYIHFPECSFLMGEKISQGDFDDDPYPSQSVTLRSFSIQKTNVSVCEWKQFLQDTGYVWRLHEEAEKVSPTDDHPIVFLSWFDAIVYCEWKSGVLGKKVRLPTEAEWEHACQLSTSHLDLGAGEQSAFATWAEEYHGLNPPVIRRKEDERHQSCLGMWDGVSQWCSDWYHEVADLPNPKKYQTETSPSWCKVWKGGNPLSEGFGRCSYRGFSDPNSRNPFLGFRTVID